MSAIPRGSRANVEGGASGPSGDGGNVKYRKNQGTADPKTGGTPGVTTGKKGRDIGKVIEIP